ncbi:MAG: orotidine 5'-phosphate decarboxylase [Lactobacillaceae bacterium]|jgi:3-hexulose-6-phosphate synthase|nr:orotidine 5'-phosphate decarboxylase [Lactobacillaceae bacterium]
MKLQLAIDRTELNETFELINQMDGIVDIIEIGTPLIKRFGMNAFANLNLQKSKLLLDLKTADESDFEFKKGYQVGADILTIMAITSFKEIQKAYDISQKQKKEILIDLLEVSDEKIKQLLVFDRAIFALHNDSSIDAAKSVRELHQKFPTIKRIGVAGGIDLKSAKEVAQDNIAEIVIVGGSILKANNPLNASEKFKEVL